MSKKEEVKKNIHTFVHNLLCKRKVTDIKEIIIKPIYVDGSKEKIMLGTTIEIKEEES